MTATHRPWGPIKQWIPATVMMAAIFIFSSIPASSLPQFGQVDLFIKKGGHFLAYALLGLSFRVGLGSFQAAAILKAWVLAVLYAASDELHQSFVPGRSPWIVDIGIDSLGAAIALFLSGFWERYKP